MKRQLQKPKPEGAKRRLQYSPSKLNAALDAVRGGMASAKAAKMYNVPRTTIRNKINGISPMLSKHSGYHSVLGAETEDEIVKWVIHCLDSGFPVTRDALLLSVAKIVAESGTADEGRLKIFIDGKPSRKWYYKFLERHPQIVSKKAEYVNRARGSVTKEKIIEWFERVRRDLGKDANILKDANRIYNFDETGFNLSPKEQILGVRGRHAYMESKNSDKENVTTLFGVCANGSMVPPLTIYKFERLPPHYKTSAPKGWSLGKTESGWMTAKAFYEYFANTFIPYLEEIKAEKPIAVFLDGHSSHLSIHLSTLCKVNGIILISLFPNATHILQPLDVAVFKSIKSEWSKVKREWRIDHCGHEITKADIPAALQKITNWRQQSDFSPIHKKKLKDCIKNGFKATGIFPFNSNNVDFSKIIDRRPFTEVSETRNGRPTNGKCSAGEVLRHIEDKLPYGLLKEFKGNIRKDKWTWKGKAEAKLLYNLWHELYEDALSNTEPDLHTCNTVGDSPMSEAASSSGLSSPQNEGRAETFSPVDINGSYEIIATIHPPFTGPWVTPNSPQTLEPYINRGEYANDIEDPSIADGDTAPSPGILEVTPKKTVFQSSPTESPNLCLNNTGTPCNLPSMVNNFSEHTSPAFNLPSMVKNSSDPTSPPVTPRTTSGLQSGTSEDRNLQSQHSMSPVVPRSLVEILSSIRSWPGVEENPKKAKKCLEARTSVLTSDVWIEIMVAKEAEKKALEEEKAKNKVNREETKKRKLLEKEQGKIQKKKKPCEEKKSDTVNWTPTADPETSLDTTQIRAGDWVAVTYEGAIYPGVVSEVVAQGFRVKCLEKSQKFYRWPSKEDQSVYSSAEIKMRLKEPLHMKRGFLNVPELSSYFID